MRIALAVAATFLAFACAQPQAAPTPRVAVHGRVTMGPTCPLQRKVPEPGCAPRPFAGTFAITGAGGAAVASVESSAEGRFDITLPPGDYVIALKSKGMMPSMAPQDFTVPPSGETDLELQVDSGMR
jgi:hypothetical protein